MADRILLLRRGDAHRARAILDAFAERTGLTPHEIPGGIEFPLGPDDHREGHAASADHVAKRLGSVGRPVPGIELQIRGEDGTVSRTGYTGEDGFEVIVRNEQAVTLWEELIGRGAVPCGLGDRDTLRLEAAMPLYGHELNETIDPIQAGLGWAVKLDKGEFVGRDALRDAAENAGKRPERIGLEVEGKRAASGPCSSSTRKPSSSRIGALTCTALSYLLPGSAPTTTKPVFLLTDPVTLPPRSWIAAVAWSRL